MKEHPILFSGPMVRAILEGRKTQTRRTSGRWDRVSVGDRLWVRETHAIAIGHMYDGEAAVRYAEGGEVRAVTDERSNSIARSRSMSRMRPSIHMPRWASRLTLEVTDIRREDLHAITADDARAEGAPANSLHPREWFFGVWAAINGHLSLNADPEVWVVSFRVVPQ